MIKDLTLITIQGPWYVSVLALCVFVIMAVGAYFFWYHVIKYPNGKPKNKK
jgi:hypothetical protein